MMENTIIFCEALDNGLIVEARDFSRRYFGNYHKVILQMTCRLPLAAEHFSDCPNPELAMQDMRNILGDVPQSTTHLERMGVAGESLEDVRAALLHSFVTHALPYMRRPDYPAHFLRSLLARHERRKPSRRMA